MTETASLGAFQRRIGWARKYLDELEETSNAFFRDGRDGTAIDYKQNDDEGWIRISVHLPNGFPEDMGRILGGAFHELRAAFDNLAYQLVLANGGTPDKQTAFPILWDCPDGEFAARTKQRLEGMSGTARATIERLQPFEERPESPKDTTLWLIHELNNIDKHRIPHLACLWIASCEGTLYTKGVTAAQLQAKMTASHFRGVAEDGTTLLEFRWNPMLRALHRNQEMMMELRVTSDVGLKNPERGTFLDPDGVPTKALPVAHFLKAALNYCDDTVTPAFAEEFQ